MNRHGLIAYLISFAAIIISVAVLTTADDNIREGVADATEESCQENNERWQDLVDYSFAQRGTDKPKSEAEKIIIRKLTKRNCAVVKERYLDKTE